MITGHTESLPKGLEIETPFYPYIKTITHNCNRVCEFYYDINTVDI